MNCNCVIKKSNVRLSNILKSPTENCFSMGNTFQAATIGFRGHPTRRTLSPLICIAVILLNCILITVICSYTSFGPEHGGEHASIHFSTGISKKQWIHHSIHIFTATILTDFNHTSLFI